MAKGWLAIQFGKLASGDPASFSIGPFGSRITRDNYVSAGVPVVRGVNLARGRFVDDGFVYISEEKADELASSILVSGDLIFTHRGTIGQVSMIPRRPRFGRYILSSSQVKARLDQTRAVPEFYYYWLSSPAGQRALLANTSTVGVPGIASPLATIRSLEVPYPPVSTQQAIAAVLGALDDKITVNDLIAEVTLSLATLHYESASRSGAWRDVSLADAATWYSGGTPSTSNASFWNGSTPWISAASLKSCWIDEAERRVTELGMQNGTRLVPKGTVIFVVRGMSLKAEFRIGLTQREVAFGQDCKALVPNGKLSPHVLLHALRGRTDEILDLVDEAGHGTGRLATDRLAQLAVRVPGNSIDPIVSLLQSLDDLAAERHRESRSLARMRDMLLPRLMSGEIRVRDAEKVIEEAT
jgi:type I restriction enzyme S subunit